MKKQKSILMAILLGLVFTFSSYASDSKAAHEAAYDLKADIYFLVKNIPWQDYVDFYENSIVVVTFRVNRNSKLEDIQVIGENEDLIRLTKMSLDRQEISADEVLIGKKYRLQIRYKHLG